MCSVCTNAVLYSLLYFLFLFVRSVFVPSLYLSGYASVSQTLNAAQHSTKCNLCFLFLHPASTEQLCFLASINSPIQNSCGAVSFSAVNTSGWICCCDQAFWSKATGEENVYLAYTSRSRSRADRSQGRSSSRSWTKNHEGSGVVWLPPG